MKILDLSSGERPRERLLASGPQALSDGELLAVILRSGTPDCNAVDLARKILSSLGGRLTGLSHLDCRDFCSIPGIGPGKAASLVAAFELGRRALLESGLQDRRRVGDASDIVRLMTPNMKGLDHEECWVVLLDRYCRPIEACGSASSRVSFSGLRRLSTGSDCSTGCNAKDVARLCIESGAASAVLVHNHPFGDPLPSTADIALTEELRAALAACGISLLDHVIFSPRGVFSFADEKIISP